MTTVQRVAMIFGVVFLLAAAAGLLAGATGMQPTHPDTAPRALGFFPVNLVHNIVHILFGIWGLVASRTWDASKTFCRVGGIIYAVLVPLGFIAPDGFGLIPLGGNDIWLHAVIALALLYFGFVQKEARPSVTTDSV